MIWEARPSGRFCSYWEDAWMAVTKVWPGVLSHPGPECVWEGAAGLGLLLILDRGTHWITESPFALSSSTSICVSLSRSVPRSLTFVLFLEHLLDMYPCSVTTAVPVCSLASRQSTAMLELAVFLPLLLRVTLVRLAISGTDYCLASPIFLKCVPRQKCRSVKDVWCLDYRFIPNSVTARGA